MNKKTNKVLRGLFFIFLIQTLLVLPARAGLNELLEIVHLPQSKSNVSLSFRSVENPNYEIFENLEKQILIIKFSETTLGSVPALFTFEDPLLEGVRIQQVGRNEFLVKIKTRITNLTYKLSREKNDPGNIILSFERILPLEEQFPGVEIIDMLRELNPTSERLIISFNKPVQYDIIKDPNQPGKLIQIRFLQTQLAENVVVAGATTSMLKSVRLEKRGKYLMLIVTPQKHPLRLKTTMRKRPVQIILDISENKNMTLAELKAKQQKLEQVEKEVSKEEKARQALLIQHFSEAEEAYQSGKFKTAGLKFKNIFNFTYDSELGVRAHFRSADSHYLLELSKKEAGDFNFVIQEYRAAINSALMADKGYDDIPRAYFNIGRSYQKKEFFEEAYNQFEILSELYPESSYSMDAMFEKGIIHLSMLRLEEAVEILGQFTIQSPGSPKVPAAFYKIGESQFQLKHYKDAKDNFDRAWSMDVDYMKQDAKLMFRMGETYFENRDYRTARSIYEQLLDRFPNESFSNLVAIRIGDFLREEDKDDDAIKAYQRAIVEYNKELLLVGKLRIANILAEKPEEGSLRKALEIYNFIIQKYPLSNQFQEALLRRALTLELFDQYPEAISKMEGFCRKFPENDYVKNHILQERILSTIKNYIAELYYNGKYLDGLGVFEQYEKKYYLRPRSSACYSKVNQLGDENQVDPLKFRAPLFIITDSYFRLGLYDKALLFSDIILQKKTEKITPTILFNKGKIYDAKDQPEIAQKIYFEFIDKYPDHLFTPRVKKALGDSYYKVRKFDRVERAIRIYQQTIRDYQDSDNPLNREIIPDCWFALGNLYQEMGQYDRSIRAYKKVLQSYEHPFEDKNVVDIVVDTHFILGNLFFELNQIPEAMEAYKTAIQLFPNSDKTPWAKYQRGQIFMKNNQTELALNIFSALIEQSKTSPDALWGPLALESQKTILNNQKFEKYLNRTPSAKLETN